MVRNLFFLGLDGCVDNCSGEPINYVCGTDFVTYANACQMKYEGCKNGKIPSVGYEGRCKN